LESKGALPSSSLCVKEYRDDALHEFLMEVLLPFLAIFIFPLANILLSVYYYEFRYRGAPEKNGMADFNFVLLLLCIGFFIGGLAGIVLVAVSGASGLGAGVALLMYGGIGLVVGPVAGAVIAIILLASHRERIRCTNRCIYYLGPALALLTAFLIFYYREEVLPLLPVFGGFMKGLYNA
jgi:MFS family permease